MIHSDLPIYKTGVRLLQMGYTLQMHMPRGMKRTLGDTIIRHTTRMLDLMALANATHRAERAAHLQQLLTHQRAVEALLRVGHEMRIGRGQVVIATTHWAAAVALLQSLGAQCGGWLKATNRAPAA